MVQIHITVGIALFALNLGAGAWGLTAWLTKRPSPGFWYLLRAAQAAVVVQAILGGLLIATSHSSTDNLHYLYGILPLGIMLITEAMRVGAAQQAVGDIDYTDIPEADQQALAMKIFIAETRVMALGCMVIAGLALRAGITSGFLG